MKLLLSLLSLVTCHLTMSAAIFAAPPLILTDDQAEYDLTDHIEVLVPGGQAWTIDDVTSPPLANDFHYVPNFVPSSTHPPLWMRFRISNESASNEKWYLEDYRPRRLTLHTVNQLGKRVETNVRYDRHSEKPIKSRTQVLPLTLTPGETRTYHVRYEWEGKAGLYTMRIWRPETFRAQERLAELWNGLYYGLLLVMALYNAFLLLSLRDQAYLWFVLLNVWYVLVQAIGFGHWSVYLWKGKEYDYWQVVVCLAGLVSICLGRFGQIFLRTRQHDLRVHRLYTFQIAYGLLACTVIALVGYASPALLGLGALQITATGLVAGVMIWKQGYTPARYWILAHTPYLVSHVILGLNQLYIIPTSFATLYAAQICFAISTVIMSLALADRINFLRREREEQEVAALDAERASHHERIQSERKSAFLASMAFELRQRLTVIKGANNLVLRETKAELPDRQQENLRKVDRASDHLLAMIDDIHDLSKIEAGRMDVNASEFDVRQTILSACDVVSPLVQDGVQLNSDIGDDVGLASTDQQRLTQMLINLLSNAIKFTESGSVVVNANVRRQSSFDSDQGDTAVSDTLTISVTDTGKGIPESELPTLFDEYRQVEGQSDSAVQKGTGLGLSITKRFAELLGGSISVQSKVGEGSTFTIEIPADLYS